MVVNNDTDSSPELIPHDDPIVQFGQWFDLAQDCGSREPSAMNLATVSADGAPQVRVVLLRGFDQAGFCFYTNLTSAKGNDLDANPRAALGFHWQPLARQVRISGVAEILSDELADAYFDSRHRDSQIGAWASRHRTLRSSRNNLSRFSSHRSRSTRMTCTCPPALEWRSSPTTETRVPAC